MTDLELQQLRREKWRLDGKAIRTIEDARGFLEETGFCLMYPQRPALLVPTFIGAFVGSDDRLPEWQHAFKDPRAAEATDLMRTTDFSWRRRCFLISMPSRENAIRKQRRRPDRGRPIPRWRATYLR